MLLNAEKIVVLTHDAQPPPFLATEQRTETYNLAAMLTAAGTQLKHIDLKFHLQRTLKLFYANRSILLDRRVCIATGFQHLFVFSPRCFFLQGLA